MRDTHITNAENFEKQNDSHNGKKSFDTLTEETRALAKQAAESLKQSGNDWLQYVNRHPIQCMLYGIILYFAVKGVWKQ